MARKPIVSRTMKTTNVVATCVNMEHEELVTVECVLPRTYPTEKALTKAMEAYAADNGMKFVSVRTATVSETRYGMSEQKFIENAEILPPLPEKVTAEQ